MKKNNQLHIFVETKLLNTLIEEAQKEEISLSELCRSKLRRKPQLDRIEEKVEKILKKPKSKII
ncbi:Uncharacterised protein [uncultured archaeon]|nr:Uncharacterised protein [uncultured archaeon]